LKRADLFSLRAYTARYRLSESRGRYVRTRTPLQRPRSWLYLASAVAATALLYANSPFKDYLIDPYDPDASSRHFQNLIDYVGERDGLVFWSMPEATDYRERSVGPFSITLSTHPYDEVLSETDGYTGFGGMYADRRRAHLAGGAWDQALMAFQRAERSSPPWLVGESAFHWTGQAGKQLDDVLTILLVAESTHAAALEALRGGHSYTVQRREGGADLRLVEFSAAPAGIQGRIDRARVGDTLEVADGAEFEIALRIEDSAGDSVPVQIELIRQGLVHRRWNETTPFERRWLETLEPEEESVYFRVNASATQAAQLISNPVFIRRLAES
jgi:hypothetical protein